MVHAAVIRRFIFLPQSYPVRSDKWQELKKDSSDFSFFYVLKIFLNVVKINFYLFLRHVIPLFYDVRKNSSIFEGYMCNDYGNEDIIQKPHGEEEILYAGIRSTGDLSSAGLRCAL